MLTIADEGGRGGQPKFHPVFYQLKADVDSYVELLSLIIYLNMIQNEGSRERIHNIT